MTRLRIALVQQPATSDLAANLANGLDAARRAAAEGAKVVCFAELAFTPFYPQDPSSALFPTWPRRFRGRSPRRFARWLRSWASWSFSISSSVTASEPTTAHR